MNYLLLFSTEVVSLKYTCQIFKVDFPENGTSDGKML